MTDELDMAEDTSDNTFFINGNEKSIVEALEGVDGLLDTIAEQGDFDAGANALRSMYAAGRAISHSMVKLCHGMYYLWKDSGRDAEQFWAWMQDATPLKRITIERYIHAWEAYLKLDDDRLLTRPLKDLVALGSAVSQGYEVDKSDVNRLIEATNNNAFLGELREIKGQEPRKSAMSLYLEPDGTINAWTKDGVEYVGYLNLPSPNAPSGVLDKAIERIIRSAGLIRR